MKRREGVSSVTASRLRDFLNIDEEVGRQIKKVEAEGRLLAQTNRKGFRSAPVLEKGKELDALFERRARIGAIIQKLRARSAG